MSMTTELNLVSVIKPTQRNPIVVRRQRLIQAIDKQIKRIEFDITGVGYGPSGRGSSVWYWLDENGNWFCAIKYAKKNLELSKGKFAIQGKTLMDLKDQLEIVKDYVVRGEFDSKLDDVAKSVRKNFGR